MVSDPTPGALSALQLLWHVSLQVVQVLHLLLLVLQTPSGPTQQRGTCQMGRWGFGEIPSQNLKQAVVHHTNLQTQLHFMTSVMQNSQSNICQGYLLNGPIRAF